MKNLLDHLDELWNLLSQKPRTVLLTHHNPDGDAIGSSLGLHHFLNKLGVENQVIVPNDFPKFLKWLPEAKKILIADYKRKKAYEALQTADLIFCLDFNSPQRVGILSENLTRSKAKKILIDHHQQPEPYELIYSDTRIPATCQMIYHLIEAMGKEDLVDENIARCLYTGIMTDTGGFRYRSTSATTHRIAAKLIENGANPADISSATWDNNTISKLRLLSLVLGRIEITHEGKVAILWLKRNELEDLGFEKGDTEGIVNYGLSLTGVELSAFFSEDLYEDFIKISFRSKGDVDTNTFARKHFMGGGHINASGGKSLLDIEHTIKRFKSLLEEDAIQLFG